MQLFYGIMELFLRMISVEIFLVLMCKIMAIIFDIAVILYIFVFKDFFQIIIRLYFIFFIEDCVT